MEWISVDERPLCYTENGKWVCYKYTDEMTLGFMAYIPTLHAGPWVGHCTMVDGKGLMGLADDEIYDIGYSWEDVAYYLPITLPLLDREKVVFIPPAFV